MDRRALTLTERFALAIGLLGAWSTSGAVAAYIMKTDGLLSPFDAKIFWVGVVVTSIILYGTLLARPLYELYKESGNNAQTGVE